jgi:hypothetical protein
MLSYNDAFRAVLDLKTRWRRSGACEPARSLMFQPIEHIYFLEDGIASVAGDSNFPLSEAETVTPQVLS